jgi:Predicted nucleotide-binding protein containing TIR-like domain
LNPKDEPSKPDQQAGAVISEEAKAKGRKAGAILFPRTSLMEALKVPQIIWENNAGNPYPILDIAPKAGYSPTTGDFRELLRSAQRYGLINESYTQDLTKTISLTALGNSLVAPTPDENVNTLKRTALETPDLFRKVLASIQGRVIPPADSMKNMLIRNHHLDKRDAEACYKILAKNIQELGIADDVRGTVYLRLDKLGTAQIAQVIPKGGEEAPEELIESGGIPIKLPPSEQPQIPQIPRQIFVAHGKNKKPLEQAVKILTDYGIPHSVAVEEANRGRPVSVKVAEEMKKCTAGIFIFTADEKTTDTDGNEVWRPSDNVVYELGAGSVLYGNKIIIFREEGVDFASDFKEIGYIPFEKNKLDAKGLELMKELQSLGIIKFQVT